MLGVVVGGASKKGCLFTKMEKKEQSGMGFIKGTGLNRNVLDLAACTELMKAG